MQLNLSLCTLCILCLVSGWATPSAARGYTEVRQEPNVNHTHRTVSRRPSPEAYDSLRNIFLDYEQSNFFGSDIELTQKELQANKKIMELKTKEYDDGLLTPHIFSPSQHVFTVLDAIRNSPLFQLLTQMPKGGVLHAHDTALCSTEYLIQLTYRENLWAHQCDGFKEVVAVKFAKTQPQTETKPNCSWGLMSKLREQYGAAKVDEVLASRFTMYPTQKFLDINDAWVSFMGIFNLLDGLLFHEPVWADYYYHALEEFYADGVQYLEFRSTLPRLYDIDGKFYDEVNTVRVYNETLTKFMAANPGFIGSKMIYAPHRNIDDKTLQHFLDICIDIKSKYPTLVAGFDLVGQEEMGRPLKEFVPLLLAAPDNIDYFFHAGETNWLGSTVDENLIDAVLLGTKRIGHGFALVKHPLALQMLKERNIAVEVNPISNQVLQLVADLRNHPCAQLFAGNYPVVISSDDPSFWKATPLTHDFYIAFLGIASAHSDLRLLKKLALNSITYSSLTTEQKYEAMQKWQPKWDAFIANINNEPTTDGQQGLMTNKMD